MRQAGVTLPRTSYSQWTVGTPVPRAAVQAGDLVFFNANGPGASHVGIAASNATVVSATSHGVREHSISGTTGAPTSAPRVGDDDQPGGAQPQDGAAGETRDFFVDLLGFEVAMDIGWVVTLASPDNPRSR